jgi:phosphoribosylformylglycinamidine cyclo-ligase
MTTYKDAGVDIGAGNRAVDLIRRHVRSTYANFPGEVFGEFDGFAGGLKLPPRTRYIKSATDGVGTKLRIAIALNRHDSIGIDLVAMCVNDLVRQGYIPFSFANYIAQGQQIPERTEQILTGIVRGCRDARVCADAGEMAEMPGMYKPGDYDLSGCAVGIASRKRDLITGRNIRPGMKLYGLKSSGVHSNGFSLIRKVCGISDDDPDVAYNILTTLYQELESTLGDELLKPTRIYVTPITELRKQYAILGLAHITGGGLTENPPRIMPKGCAALIDLDRWDMPSVFEFLRVRGRIPPSEMRRTFNLGIGMMAVSPDEIPEEEALLIGEVVESSSGTTQFVGGTHLT